jgi:hypothetical protein
MRKILMLLALTGCAEDPPSCQQAMTHFYSSGCYFLDVRVMPPVRISQNDAYLSCQDINRSVPDRCEAYFEDWLFCLDSRPPGSGDAVCGECSQEQDALIGCQ